MSGNDNYANSAALVSTAWVAEHLNDPTVRLFEVDVDTAAYERGHICCAVGVNWQTQLGDQVRRDILSPESWAQLLSEAGVQDIRTPTQVHLAYACGYSRPVVESIMASLLCRGAARLTYQGHRGAIVQTGMAVMAHNAATLVRIHEYRLEAGPHVPPTAAVEMP